LVQTVQLDVPRQQGEGITVFQNARLIRVADPAGVGPVIEHGTIVVQGRRIEAVGNDGEVAIPAGAIVVDASGTTIMPGLVDVHYHGLQQSAFSGSPVPGGGRLSGPSALAYGVTTVLEPMGNTGDASLSLSELRESGRSPGPRWFFVNVNIDAWIWNPPEGANVTGIESAKARLQLKVALGAEQVLKERSNTDRQRAQWYAEAARQLGIVIMAHTNDFRELLKRAADGYPVEHEPFPVPLYGDVKQFLAQTGTIWTPTMISDGRDTTTPNYFTAAKAFLNEVRERGQSDADKLHR